MGARDIEPPEFNLPRTFAVGDRVIIDNKDNPADFLNGWRARVAEDLGDSLPDPKRPEKKTGVLLRLRLVPPYQAEIQGGQIITAIFWEDQLIPDGAPTAEVALAWAKPAVQRRVESEDYFMGVKQDKDTSAKPAKGPKPKAKPKGGKKK